VAGFGAGVWSFAFRDGLDRLSERGEADLSLAADRLSGHLLRYRELAVVLARHPVLRAVLTASGDVEAGQKLVVSMADISGADAVSLVDLEGAVIVTSAAKRDAENANSLPLSRALQGALGTGHQVITAPNGATKRIFSFAAPVLDAQGQIAGAVVTKANVLDIEENWPGRAPAVLFSDATGRVLVSDRSELVLTDRSMGERFPEYQERRINTHVVWTLHDAPFLPDRALYLHQSLPVLGLQAEILLDTDAAERSAYLQAAAAAALFLVFGALMFLIVQYSRVLRLRLAAEAETNELLEQRVAERTQELQREVKERRDAEMALKKAQNELVQAGKLSALGQMSAGISHELNQPLMAIRSFAENGTMLIDKEKPDVARENLSRISDLARRMGRIIKNLRAFARQETGPMTDVDLVQAVNAALEMTAETMTRCGVTLDWQPPGVPVMVRGGEVRLTQVVVNLISNASDAMDNAAAKRIEVRINTGEDAVELTVRDTGPGIVDPERVFEPFYTTKAVGAAEGMGLGLSISYGLVQSFGGAIQGHNHPEGGAVFTVGLLPASLEVAA